MIAGCQLPSRAAKESMLRFERPRITQQHKAARATNAPCCLSPVLHFLVLGKLSLPNSCLSGHASKATRAGQAPQRNRWEAEVFKGAEASYPWRLRLRESSRERSGQLGFGWKAIDPH